VIAEVVAVAADAVIVADATKTTGDRQEHEEAMISYSYCLNDCWKSPVDTFGRPVYGSNPFDPTVMAKKVEVEEF